MSAAKGQAHPVIIVKKKKGGHGGHHGGAWKVAYADFVTAMMAFFLLMWLLGSTTEGDKKGIADFFQSPLKVAMFGGSGAGDASHLIKGGGAALTREKIVAAQSKQFVCIADASKKVEVLGHFPLPVEIIPMASQRLIRQFAAMGGQAAVRMQGDQALVTDNGQHILDVRGLKITQPKAFETEVSQWPGVITVGVFAHQKAQICLLGTADGVQTLSYA